jgi:hypothetical protein
MNHLKTLMWQLLTMSKNPNTVCYDIYESKSKASAMLRIVWGSSFCETRKISLFIFALGVSIPQPTRVMCDILLLRSIGKS